jgi:hypothetical protein
MHFLNVGHGDCTIIEHPSGRLSMIDVNNSQDYDTDSFGEVFAEQREKQRARELAGALTALGGNPLTGFGALGNSSMPQPNVLAQATQAIEVGIFIKSFDPVGWDSTQETTTEGRSYLRSRVMRMALSAATTSKSSRPPRR